MTLKGVGVDMNVSMRGMSMIHMGVTELLGSPKILKVSGATSDEHRPTKAEWKRSAEAAVAHKSANPCGS